MKQNVTALTDHAKMIMFPKRQADRALSLPFSASISSHESNTETLQSTVLVDDVPDVAANAENVLKSPGMLANAQSFPLRSFVSRYTHVSYYLLLVIDSTNPRL